MNETQARRVGAEVRLKKPVRPRGHFAAQEEPALLASDLTEFFRPLW